MKSTWLLCFNAFIAQKIYHDYKLFPARKCLTLRACAVDSFHRQHFWNGSDFCSFFSMYQTKFDMKMTKSEWNYTANMIVNVSGTVCQRIHYFPGKQWLAINPKWPALKVNNAHGFDIISWSVWILILLAFFLQTLKEYEIITLIYNRKLCMLDLLYFWAPEDIIL